MVIMVSLSQRDERHPPAVSTGIGPTVGLTSPQMTDGIDAERGVQHQKDPPGTGQHEAAHTTYSAVVDVPDEKRQRQSGQEKGHIPAMLPHHYRIFPQPGRISFSSVGALHEEPHTVAIAESVRRVVGILLLIHSRMVSSMIGSPFQRRVLHCPAARDQERHLDPVVAPEATMRNRPVVSHGNAKSADEEIEHAGEGPVQLRIAMDIAKERHPDET